MTLREWKFTLLIAVFLASCASSHKKPCSEGGQPAREATAQIAFKGKRSCYQEKDDSGVYVNHGKYFEWYNSDRIALEGEYNRGKKTGRWIEYDEKGIKTSDKYFEEGKEVPAP